ncbi:hypothetical protein POTOM_056351 [Populus tomentosa]|uniref:Fatty acid desaturase domain-containing protein n=1 Tax=Populus tomentosa TaxID=118781 RepID=A0A8X7Y1V5_POPTO|nr:hypothetical protein POTOM_056351 [Populus tomentosa]
MVGSMRSTRTVQAVAVPAAPSFADSAEFRKHLAESYGFRKIGEQLPDNVTLKDVLDSPMDSLCLDMDRNCSYSGHDCAHKSFSKNKLVEDIVGTLAFLPLVEDTAWHPVWEEEFDSSPVLRKAILSGDGPFGPWISIAHWALLSFTAIYALVPGTSGLSLLLPLTDEWNAAQAQLNGTIHCDYTCWIEILCHDINVHIPHHVSARIPHYNLRVAHKSLQENWGKLTCMNLNLVCHVYDKEENHVAFDKLAPQESHPVTFLKRVMPDYA